jgi:hypothetical protein
MEDLSPLPERLGRLVVDVEVGLDDLAGKGSEAAPVAAVPLGVEGRPVRKSSKSANGCDYCLAIHTAGSRHGGMTPEDIELCKAGSSIDPKQSERC